jgi:hypothetical protein
VEAFLSVAQHRSFRRAAAGVHADAPHAVAPLRAPQAATPPRR